MASATCKFNLRSRKRLKVGFEVEFVEEPPDTIMQLNCPICLQVLREPYQATCCGNSFCQVCIENLKTGNKNASCPTCNKKKFTTFHDKRLQRSLYSLVVYCSHKQEGCEWKGELGQLDDHLNESPYPSKQLEGCEYTEVKCFYCSYVAKRCKVIIHQKDLCPKRPFSCEYCHSFTSSYENVLKRHHLTCSSNLIQCPNKCLQSVIKSDLENHIARECPKTVVDCDFHQFGCDVRLPREDMSAHLQDNLVTHMSLQAASYGQVLDKMEKLESEKNSLGDRISELEGEKGLLEDQMGEIEAKNESLENRVKELEEKNKSLTVQVRELGEENEFFLNRVRAIQDESGIQRERMGDLLGERILELEEYYDALRHHADVLPLQIVMENFEYFRRIHYLWYSQPFYTHPGGYKLCLRVDANGTGTGFDSHVSVFLFLMKGNYDAQLKWPFRGMITIHLVNQQEEEKYYVKELSFSSKAPPFSTSRVISGEMSQGWGFEKFIWRIELAAKYLKNDCLYFRVYFSQLKELE